MNSPATRPDAEIEPRYGWVVVWASFVALAVIDSSLSAELRGSAPARAPRFFAADVPAEEAATFRAAVRTAAPTARIEAVELTSGDVTYTTPPPAAPGFWSAPNFSARESISLLQARSVPTITTTGAGTILDFALRLPGPVLLAFAVLAVRARTKC